MTHTDPATPPMLQIDHLSVEYRMRHGVVRAVSDVTLGLAPGETLGLVGESGCGKSTTGKAIVQIVRPSAGRVLFDGVDLCALSGTELRRARTGIQMIFQDPISSLNPKHTVRDIVAEPLRVWNRGTKAERTEAVAATLEAVGLDPGVAMARRPHQFSGGQCQRISIARALVLEPKVLICDEPVSALDVSVQAQICNLLEDMKARFGLTIVFIAHDLAVVRNISDRVAVMYLGKLCEVARPTSLYRSPAHPYTDALLKSVPVPDPQVPPLRAGLVTGEPPSPLDPPSGCRFRTRCPRAESICATQEPALRPVGEGHQVACHFPLVSVELTKQDLQHAH